MKIFSIYYNVRYLSNCGFELKYHFRQNSKFYLSFFAVIILAVILALVIIASSDSYLNLLVSSNRILYGFINGTANLGEIFWTRLIGYLVPAVFILVLGINFYLSLFSYLIIGYQFMIFVMTCFAVIDLFGVAGILDCLILIIPLNLLFFADLIFMSVVCLERSKSALKYRYFFEGYNKSYFVKLAISFFVILFLAIIVSIVYPLILKSAIFLIY